MKIFLVSFLFSLSLNAADCTKWVGPVENKKLDEISGIAFSRIHKNVLYAHNDSGDKPRIFAMSSKGKHLAEFTIDGAKHKDWEDLTMMSCPGEASKSCIAVGDIGNNRYNRPTMTIYIAKEPSHFKTSKTAILPLYKKIEFSLDTDQQNFESLTSFGENLYLISKMDGNAEQRYPGEEGKSILYKLDMKKKKANTIARLDLLKTKEFYTRNEQGESVLKVPNHYSWATAADLSRDGKKLVLLTYGTIFEYDLGAGGIDNPDFSNYKIVKIPNQPQVEAVALNSYGTFVVSEYKHQPIYKIGCQ